MHDDQEPVTTTINDLKAVRNETMLFVAVACALGVVWLLAGVAVEHIPTLSFLRPFSVAFPWLGLFAISTVLVGILWVWIPVHDRVIVSLRLSFGVWHLQQVSFSDDFQSANLRHPTPPPRRHLR